MAGTVPRGAVRLEAEAAMGLDSVVTLALGLGTGGTAERRLRPSPRPGGVPTVGGPVAERVQTQGSEPKPLGPGGRPGNRGLRAGRKGHKRGR